MGFDEQQAIDALRLHGNRQEDAVRVLDALYCICLRHHTLTVTGLIGSFLVIQYSVKGCAVYQHAFNSNFQCEYLLSEQGPSVPSCSDLEQGLDPDSAVFKAIMDNPTIQLGLANPRSLVGEWKHLAIQLGLK